MASRIHKPYIPLEGKPLLFHTLEKFLSLPFIQERILVIHKRDQRRVLGEFKGRLEELGVGRVVLGGPRRQDSVRAGLDASNPHYPIVLVHDAVRPFIRPEIITEVIEEAEKWGSAIVALPAPDTIKRVKTRGIILETLSRKGIYLAQTPQCFKRDLLTAAMKKSEAEGWEVSDEAQLMERMNIPVHVVPGDPFNIKITAPEDFELARAILRLQRRGSPRP